MFLVNRPTPFQQAIILVQPANCDTNRVLGQKSNQLDQLLTICLAPCHLNAISTEPNDRRCKAGGEREAVGADVGARAVAWSESGERICVAQPERCHPNRTVAICPGAPLLWSVGN